MQLSHRQTSANQGQNNGLSSSVVGEKKVTHHHNRKMSQPNPPANIIGNTILLKKSPGKADQHPRIIIGGGTMIDVNYN